MFRRSRVLLSFLVATTVATGWLALASPPTVAAGTADLAVTIDGEKKALKFGKTMTFAVTVTNNGPDAATGVTLGVGTSDSYANFGGTCPDGTTSTFCDVGTLAPGATVSVPYRVGASNACCPDLLGVAVASVSHDTETVDPVTANDSVRIETKLTGKPPPDRR